MDSNCKSIAIVIAATFRLFLADLVLADDLVKYKLDPEHRPTRLRSERGVNFNPPMSYFFGRRNDPQSEAWIWFTDESKSGPHPKRDYQYLRSLGGLKPIGPRICDFYGNDFDGGQLTDYTDYVPVKYRPEPKGHTFAWKQRNGELFWNDELQMPGWIEVLECPLPQKPEGYARAKLRIQAPPYAEEKNALGHRVSLFYARPDVLWVRAGEILASDSHGYKIINVVPHGIELEIKGQNSRRFYLVGWIEIDPEPIWFPADAMRPMNVPRKIPKGAL